MPTKSNRSVEDETLIDLFTQSIEQLVLTAPNDALEFTLDAYEWAITHNKPTVAEAMAHNI
jgi:hypothetical protein